MRDERLKLEAQAGFWHHLATYAGWLLEKAEGFEPQSEDHCPRVGAQQAAETYLAAHRRQRKRRKQWTMTMTVHHWSWLARGLYEAEQHQDRPAGEVPRSREVAVHLARLLARADVWPVRHGRTVVDLRQWEWYEVYPYWRTE